jgi:hypothetical protein
MLSKLVTRFAQQQNITYLTSRAFRAAPQLNKKPSIGDAVTILQSKVSNINQVVSSNGSTVFTDPFLGDQPPIFHKNGCPPH